MRASSLSFALFLACFGLAGCPSPSTPDGDGGTPGADAGSEACSGMPDGTECGSGLLCIDEECVESMCGDGFVDDATSEACDDGNDVAFDGCEPGTCTFTCTTSTDCADTAV